MSNDQDADDPRLADGGDPTKASGYRKNRSWGTHGDARDLRDRNSTSYDPSMMAELDLGAPKKPENEYQALMEAAPHAEILEDQETFDKRMHPLREAMEDPNLLTERERFIIEARFYWRMSVREVAAILPWSATHVHRLEHQAQQKLAEHVKEHYT